MKQLQLDVIRKQILTSLHANPAEVLLGLCFFVMMVMGDVLPYPESQPWRQMPFMFPILFAVTYCSNYLFREKCRWVYGFSLLTLVPLILLSHQLNDFIDSPAYGFTVILTFFLMLGHRKAADNTAFASQSLKLIVDVAFSVAIGLLLIGTIFAIYFSVIYIFDLSESGRVLTYVVSFVFYLFVPLFFCWLQREQETGWETLPGVLQFVLNFILSPGIIIYTGILYLYFITIVFAWELPKGGVAYMVMAFIGVTLLGRMLQLIVSRRYYDWFYRPFGFIAIPPLVLFWVGSMHRICTYSFTESRVYLLAAGVLMTLYVFLLYSKRLGSYRLMLLISSMVIVLLTYIPGITARSIGLWAQTQRMERLARKLSLWDEATGKLVGTAAFQSVDSAQLFAARELSASYEYLAAAEGKDEIAARYGDMDLEQVSDDNSSHYYSRPTVDIPLEGYTRYLTGCSIYFPTSNTLNVRQKDRLLLEVDWTEHFRKNKEIMSLWKNDAMDIAPFCFENDSCLVVIESIRRDGDGSYVADPYGNVLVFEK